MPRTVAKPAKERDTAAWTEQQVDRFLAVTTEHRWAIAFRLGVLYGLRRSEVLALRWNDLDTEKQTLRIDESLVATNEGTAWGNAKNERSRRTIPIDPDTMRVFALRRAEQAAERLAAGTAWEDNDVIIATRTGRLVLPRSYDRALAIIVDTAGLPRLTSQGCATPLRSTWFSPRATSASSVQSPTSWGTAPMLMNTYAHALPNSQAAVVDRLRRER